MKNKWLVVILAVVTLLCVTLALTACNGDETTEHTYGEWIAEVPATCTHAGTKAHYYCADCGKYFDADKNEVTAESLVIAALGHTYGDLIGEVDSTCAADGMQAHYYCEVCETYFDAGQNETAEKDLVIPAKQHKLEKVNGEEASCTEDGLLTHWHCEKCGNDYADEDGTTLLNDTVIHSPGHAYGELIGKADATCEEDGMEAHYYCEACQTYFDENKTETTQEDLVITSTGHDPEEVRGNQATCTSDGVKAHWHCNNCGNNYKDQACSELIEDVVIPELGHDVDDEALNITKIPTFDQEGSFTTGSCRRECGYTGGVHTLPKLDNEKYAISGNTATCEVGGRGTYTIVVDDITVHFEADTVALGHTYGELIGKVDATCEYEGMEAHYFCEACDTYFNDQQAKTTKQELTIAATGHNYEVAWVWSLTPIDGYIEATARFTCSNCDDFKSVSTKDISTQTVEATCSTPGKITYTATVTFNGTQYSNEREVSIPIIAHSYGEAEWSWTGAEATATFKCTACQDEQTETAEISSRVTATCTEAGKTIYTATVSFNEQQYTDTKEVDAEALGHDFEDYACKRGDFDIRKPTGATLETNEEQTKVYFVVSGKFAHYDTIELEAVLKAIPFDLQHNGFLGGNNWGGNWDTFNGFECYVEFEEGTWAIKYDITNMPANANDYIPYYTSHFGGDFKLPTDQAEDISVRVSNKTYAIVNFYGQDDVNTGYGTVALKVTDLSEPTYAVTYATIEANEDQTKVYFVLSGTYNNYAEDVLQGILTDVQFDFESRGDWIKYNSLERTVSVSGGVWTIKFDVTTLPLHENAYTGHFAGTDLKLDTTIAQDGYEVVAGGRAYILVNRAGSAAESDNWGCVSLRIEDATQPTFNITGATLNLDTSDGKVYLVLYATIRGYNLEENVITVGDGDDILDLTYHESTFSSYTLYFDITERATSDKPMWCHLYIDGVLSTHSQDGNIYAGSSETRIESNGKTYRFNRGDNSWWVLQLIVE